MEQTFLGCGDVRLIKDVLAQQYLLVRSICEINLKLLKSNGKKYICGHALSFDYVFLNPRSIL